MRFVNWKNLTETQGNLLHVWGPSGVGKSATTLQTAEDPIAYITAEKRKIGTTMAAINRPDLKMKVAVYDSFLNCLDIMRDLKRWEGVKTGVIDSFTHLMAAQLAFELLDQDYNSKSDTEKEGIIKELTMQVKMSKESYGALADNMLRFMNAIQDLTMSGINIVCISRDAERPKYNKEVAYGPALSGQKFGDAMMGYFDFVGMLSPEKHGDDDVPPPFNSDIKTLWQHHAPRISFNTNDTYLAKWTGPIGPKGIINRKFNVRKIFEEGNGIYT